MSKLDVRSLKNWQEVVNSAVESFGRLDVVVNNAGFLKPGKGYEADENSTDLHIDINLKV